MNHISDDDLVRLYCEGDADAFDALFDRHYDSVYNFARMMLRSDSDAEDTLQEVFLAVARNADSYRGPERFRPWLMRITRNRSLNRIEARRSRRAAMTSSQLELVEPANDDPTPAEMVEQDERAVLVRNAVAELPDRQREALALYSFEHMAYQEIADSMDMPINTIKTLIHRARAAVAQKLRRLHQE